MAVNHILRLCDYSLGGLKPFIYLIDKSALKLNIKAKGIEVFFQKRKNGDVKKVEASLCVYNQDETYANKFRFNSTLQVTVNEQYEEPFLYGLKELRKGQYYIIVEDMKGTQYLVNPELYTKFEYEYRFVNSGDNYNSVVMKFTNLSNFPLLIFAEKVESNVLLFGNKCDYNIGEAAKLNMCLYNDLKVNDDGVLVNELYIDNIDNLKNVEFMKDSFTLKEVYDGKWFRSEMEFSLPLSNHQFEWAYDLIEFKNNKYKALVKTTNNNVIVVGNEKGLFPSYEIKTSEEVETPNMITFKFTHMSQYPIVYSLDIKQFRWIEDEPLCFGFDKYQMLKQQFSTDGGDTWQDTDPIVKKKGDIIESNSNDCKLTRWVDDDTYCHILGNEYIKWMNVNESYVCDNGNKYEKLQKYISTDDVTFTSVEEYARGELIESKSNDCRYVAVRWVDDDRYACYEVDETQTRWVDIGEPICIDVNLFKTEYEEVTNNGITYHQTGEHRNGTIIEENSCLCGYRLTEYRKSNELICGSEIGKSGTNIYEIWYEWSYCPTDSSYDEKTGRKDYRNPQPSCECGWTGTSFVFNNVYICGSEIGTEYEQTSKYEVWEEIDLCTNDKTGNVDYRNPQPSCDCGWTGTSFVFNNIYKCGSELSKFTIERYEGNWIVEGNTFTSNKIGNSKNTKEKIYFKGTKKINISYIQDSEKNYDYAFIGKIDATVSSGSSSTYIMNTKGQTSGSVTIEVPDSNEHFIELLYKKDGSGSKGKDNIIITIKDEYELTSKYEVWEEEYICTHEKTGNVDYRNPQPSCDCGYILTEYRNSGEFICGSEIGTEYEPTSKYEVWEEWSYCPLGSSYDTKTGNIEYRNPQPSYDCGLLTYEWRLEQDSICGSELPSNTEIVDTPPTNNTLNE